MKAMILAAGFGTRLKLLTDKKPKALLPVVNRPIIDRNIEYLKNFRMDGVIVNAHHHYRQIANYLMADRSFGVDVDVRVEHEILGTGGGIKNTFDFWDDEPFIVINADILTDIDIISAYKQHRKSGALATLIVHDYGPFNQIKLDNNQNITSIGAKSGPGKLAFTGIHIIEPDLLAHIPDGVFSDIIDCYRKLIKSGKPIMAHISTGHYWRDIGTVESYIIANKDFLNNEPFSIGTGCHIDTSVRLDEWAVIGMKSRLERAVEIKRSILWDNVKVKKGIKIIDSIVISSGEVTRDLVGEVFKG